MSASALLTMGGQTRQADLLDDGSCDWEAPAGGCAAPFPRDGPAAYVYRDQADSHLVGQPCYPTSLPDASDPGRCTVIFACGCVAAVAVRHLDAAAPPRRIA